MSCTINASNSSGLVTSADTSTILSLQTNNTTAVTVDASQNVGIGVTPFTNTLSKSFDLAGGAGLFGYANQMELSANAYFDTAWKYKATSYAGLYEMVNGQHIWKNAPSGTAGNTITFTEAMRIDSSGNVLVGTTNSSATAGGGFKLLPDATFGGNLMSVVGAATSNSFQGYYLYSTGAGAARFYVGYGGTIFATSTSITAISDETLKENVRDLDVGLNEVMALKPRRFDWKEETQIEDKNVAGFIAQEVADVLPELVYDYQYNETETKKALKMGDMLPTLVKAIQELKAIVDTQAEQIKVLENKIV